uniref:XK-related protein n=1 Tax=Tetranychus urticae TaxID=32264 RepID=T1K3B2_TETUR
MFSFQIPTVTARSAIPSGPLALFKITSFQRMLIFSLMKLGIYLNKLYQDFGATYEYKDHREYNFFAISIVSLVAPSILYALFLIGANLSKDDVVDKKEVSTRTVNGILLIPWQIKRHLDVLHFTAQRVCNWRSPYEEESQNLEQLKMSADVLEFFEDFYAGFLQILLQIYIFLGTVDWIDSHKLQMKPLVSQIIASILSIFSMMIAVRRRDDGKLTHFLSFFGWLSFISSRVLVLGLVTTVIHSWVIVLCLIHVLVFSIWIYNIALESYGISSSSANMTNTQWSSRRKRLSIAVMVFLFFGVPSLFIWPIMFQLKEGKRPLIFLLVATIENLLLLGVWLIWLMINEGSHLNDSLVLFIIGIVAATLAGDFLLMMYVFCKPKYTDQVILYEIQQSRNMDAPTLVRLDGATNRASDAIRYGVFYAFCDIVFKLPSTHKIASGLEQVRQMQL